MEEKPWFKSWPSDVPRHLDYPDIPLHGILSRTSKAHPNRVAIVFSEQEITYKELDFLTDKFASSLTVSGVRKSERVAIFLPNIPQFIIAYYGILKTGAVITTISPMHKEREVEQQLVDSEAETIITSEVAHPIVEAVKQKTRLKNIIIVRSSDYSKTFTYNPTVVRGPSISFFEEMLKGKVEKPKEISISPKNDLAALQYTGGTTGTSKGAMLTHENLVANALAFAGWIKGTSAEETFLTALPLFHIYGMTTSLNVPVILAAKMVLLPRFDPAKAIDTIQRQKVTVFCGVPTMYQALLSSPELGKHDLTSIRVCISGASPLPPQVQEGFMQVTGGLLAEGYGLTEASPVTHCSPVDQTMRTVKVGSIGLPLPDTDARIVDAETGEKLLPVGEIGELAVKGPQVMKGYWRRPDETAEVLRGDWLLTGDLARVDSEGYFYLVDRKKDLIKYKDYSVYPREIEDVLYEHPAVKLCAVIGKPDLMAGEIPKAFVVLKADHEISGKEIVDFVNGKLAPYKAIRELELRKDLPISSAGKVLRRVLSEEEKSKTFNH